MELDKSYESVDVEQSVEQLKVEEKAASVPVVPQDKNKLKTQISAPSYLFSLENVAPPFKKPGKEDKPHLVIGTIMNHDEAISMIAASDDDPIHGLNIFLGKFLVEKNIVFGCSRTEKKFLISLIKDTIDYAALRDYNAHKLSCLLTLYLTTHMYFKWYYWSSPIAVWSYFKEMMIRHTVEDSPDGQHVFEAEECYDILTHFHAAYMNNLPLVHILTFGENRLKINWPFKMK